MLNRQDSLLSSSHRKTPPPEKRSREKSIGCMSGIFQLLISKYHSKTKRLTSDRKRGKSSEDLAPAAPGAANKILTTDDGREKEVKIQRSPALRPEIRRSHPESANARPALVARLMGLEEEQSPEVKRRMVLQAALDKCNQDLEALKKIIKAVESSSEKGASTPPATVETCKKRSAEHQALSPISVLDEQTMITRSPTLIRIQQNNYALPNVQQSKQAAKKKMKTSSYQAKREDMVASPPVMRCSKAMVQSVEEVCRYVACGEHRETRQIGAVLQDYICTDLIHEIVKDLGSSPFTLSLPFDACRRRLCL